MFHVVHVLFASINVFKIAPYCCPMLTELRVSRKIFVKVPNIILYGNLSIGNGADTCRPGNKQTDRRFSIFVLTLLKTHHFPHTVCLCIPYSSYRLLSYTAFTV